MARTAEAALVVQGLCAGYGGGDILHDVSFTVPEGGITCIVGPNGAGKSTLLAGISGLLRPRRGRVLLHGEPVTGRSPRQILGLGLVHVPQHHSLFRDMTVAENLDLGGYTIRDHKLLGRRRAQVLELFPEVAAWAPRKAGQPVRRPAAAGRIRPVPHARPVLDHPGRAVDGPGPQGAAVGLRRRPYDEHRRARRSCSWNRTRARACGCPPTEWCWKTGGSGCPGPGARYSRTRRSGPCTWAVRPAPRPAVLP